MNVTTIFEFGTLAPHGASGGDQHVPPAVFEWLAEESLRITEREEASWLKLTQRRGCRVVQVTSFVGVIRAPNGYQIEVLPKVGKAIKDGEDAARQRLIEMLCCLREFRHVRTERAELAARRMPLLEVFIGEFLSAVEHVVKRGLRSDYIQERGNLFALRGKLLVAQHLRENLFRADRFFTEHDEFSVNRPENRLLHTALRRVLAMAASQENQRLARELCFAFADIPESVDAAQDLRRVRLDRGMGHYDEAIAWARLILDEDSPLTGAGRHRAASLLFPMEAVFEAYVAKHLAKQLLPSLRLRSQVQSRHLVRHCGNDWFRLKPDLLVRKGEQDLMVLDTKWKVLDASKRTGKEKYGLDQNDFYQLYAYGQNYLEGMGDVVLLYPKTDLFPAPLKVFEFPKSLGLRLWALPFCLEIQRLLIPDSGPFQGIFGHHSD